jgi:hypothetical protein
MAVWVPGVDQTTGHIITETEWKELLGTDGSLNYLGAEHNHDGSAGSGAVVLPTFFMMSVGADDTTTSAAYEDFAALTLSVVLAVKSDVLVILTIGGVTHDTIIDTSNVIIYWGAGTEATTEITNVITEGGWSHPNATSILKPGVAAGTYTCKGQIKITGAATATFTNGVLSVIAIPVA